MGKETVKGHVIALGCILIWSSVMISTKILLETIQPVDILFWRFFIGYFMLWILYPHPLKLKTRKHEWIFFFCGLTGVNFYFYLQNSALEITRASDVSIIICIAPMLTALLQQLVKRKRTLSVFFYIGFIIAILGVMLVCGSGDTGTISIRGDLMTVGAAAAWAFYSVLGERAAGEGYAAIACVRRYFFYGLITMIPMLAAQGMTDIKEIMRPKIVGNLCYMGVGASAFAYVLWNISIEKIGVVQTNLYLYLFPVVTIAIAAIMLGEKITLGIAVGALLTVLGLVLSEKR